MVAVAVVAVEPRELGAPLVAVVVVLVSLLPLLPLPFFSCIARSWAWR